MKHVKREFAAEMLRPLNICPRCGSDIISVERRINGYIRCLDCGFMEKNKQNDDHIVTTCHEDRGYKKCLCCLCEVIKQCTPDFDFYTTKDHGDKLVCEQCFREYISHRLNTKQDTK